MATVVNRKPTSVKIDLKTEVQKVENLDAPRVEYQFSNNRKFMRSPKAKTGIYEPS